MKIKKSTVLLTCLTFLFATNPLVAQVNIAKIKQDLLKDQDFIKQISSHIDKTTVETIIRNYLINHPDIMVDVQQSLIKQQNQKISLERKSLLKKILPTLCDPKQDLIIGNVNAKHTIYEFLDFNCGYCKRSYSTLVNFVKKHPNIRVVIKELPILGNDSVAVHTVSRAFHSIMPSKQSLFVEKIMSSPNHANIDDAIAIAQKLGVKPSDITKQLNDQSKVKELQKYIRDNIRLAVSLKITGTPTYIFDDKVLDGAIDLNQIASKLT